MDQIRYTVITVLEELENISLAKPISFEFIIIEYSNTEQTIPNRVLASGESSKSVNKKKTIIKKINFEINKNI